MKRAAALVAAAALAAWLPSLGGTFQFDDYKVIVDYPTVHSWPALFERAGGGVRALLKASYTLNWTLDPRPAGFLLVNVALHATNAALVFLLGRSLFPRHAAAALAAALLFALHPAQSEAVSYVSGRSSSLMATFYLGALLLYLNGRSWWSCLAFVAALATRETAVTLPVALVLCDLARGRIEWRRQLAHWLVLAAGGLVLLLVPRYYELVAYGFSQRSLADNFVTQIGGISYLVLRLVSLHGYNIDPGLPTLHSLDATLVLQASLLLALLALGVLWWRARPWLGFGILWFFVQLAPTNSLVPRLDVANDRQLYLACWGLFLALSIQLSLLTSSTLKRAAAASVLTVFFLTSVARQLDYRDEITLWEAAVREAPWNPRARTNLGYAYWLAGRKDDAWRETRAALAFDPRFHQARANLLLLDWK